MILGFVRCKASKPQPPAHIKKGTTSVPYNDLTKK